MNSAILLEVNNCQKEMKVIQGSIVHKPYHEKGKAQLVEALDVMMRLWKIAKEEGWLAMEEDCKTISENKFITSCLNKLVPVLTDGCDEERFVELAMLDYYREVYDDYYDALSHLMLIVGCIYIIREDIRLEESLQLMFPKDDDIEKLYEEKAKIREEQNMAEFLEKGQAAFDRVCAYKSPHRELESHNRYIYESDKIIQAMIDRDIDLFLRNVDNLDLAVAMTQYDGLTNKHIMSHMSSRLRASMALEVETLNKEVTAGDANLSCGRLMDVMSKLNLI